MRRGFDSDSLSVIKLGDGERLADLTGGEELGGHTLNELIALTEAIKLAVFVDLDCLQILGHWLVEILGDGEIRFFAHITGLGDEL